MRIFERQSRFLAIIVPSRMAFSLSIVLLLTGHLWSQNPTAQFQVSGKVVNAVNGHALAGAEVWFGNAYQFDATQQKLVTGEDGTFSFTVSEPGKYLLNGQATGFRRQGFEQHGMYVSAIVVGAKVNSQNILFRLRPDARVMGVVEDDDHEPVPAATVYLFRTDASFGLRQTYLWQQTNTDDRGRYRMAHVEPGCYYLLVSANPWFSGLLQTVENASNSIASQKPEINVAFPTTFYPGVTDAASASQIALNEGQDFTADFTLDPVPALRLRVSRVVDSPEKAVGASLEQRIFGTTINQMWHRQVTVDDWIEIRGVAPGRYVLDIDSYDGSGVKRSTPLNLTSDSEVDAESASTVTPIHGVVHFEGGENAPAQGTVRLWNSRTDEVLDSQIGDKGQISFDAAFLTPGTYSVYAMTGLNSIVTGLKAKGAQVAGQTIQVAGGKAVELEIEISSSLSKINGTARRDGKPTAGAMILLVPEHAEFNLPKFRRDQSDSDGTFTLLDVLPGRYRMLAIDDGWELEWGNLSLLKKRLEHAQSIEVQPSKTYSRIVDVE